MASNHQPQKITEAKISNVALAIMAASLTLYTTKIFSLSPVYFFYCLSFFLFLLELISGKAFKTPKDSIIAIILLMYIGCTNITYFDTGEYINIVLGLFAYIYARSKPYNSAFHKKLFIIYTAFAYTILTADTLYRLSHPQAPSSEAETALDSDANLWFYFYKFGTLLFADSNTVGLILVIQLFSTLAVRDSLELGFAYKKRFIIFHAIITLLTFSRAAIMATIIGLIYFGIKSIKSHKVKLTILAVTLLAAPPLIIFIFASLSNDGSFVSKLFIYNQVISIFFSLPTFDVLFGIGLHKSIETLGIYTHLLPLTYLVESGLIGLIFFMTFIVIYSIRFGIVVTLPLLVLSMSYFLYLGAPFLYLPLALVANVIEQHTPVAASMLEK